MSRTQWTLTLAGVAITAGTAGCAAGFLLAPASGLEIRRRLAWRLADEKRSLGRACEHAFNSVKEAVRSEIERRTCEIRNAA